MGKKLEIEDGITEYEEKLLEKAKINGYPKNYVEELRKDLSKPHYVYSGVAFTNNYIIALDKYSSPNGVLTSIDYSKIAWIYVDTANTVNFYRVISLAYDGDIPHYATFVKMQMAVDFLNGLRRAMMTGAATIDNKTVLIFFSAKRQAIILYDSQERMSSGARSSFTGKIKGSKSLKTILKVLDEQCPNVAIGPEYEDEYRKLVGVEAIETLDCDPHEDFDAEDM